ncbi:hypothetical protein R1sor_001706 [Riccia sorocarpa]|uniref:Uncharacterized protein n=1 Tax=Riccia sorocarpa TaxID=122646 RepID=A0ABD3GZE4_9MARC
MESPENTSVDGSDPDNGVHADGEETLDNSVPTTDEDMHDWLIDNEEAVTDARGSNQSPMPAPIDSEQDFQDDLNKVGFSSVQSKEEGSATKKKGDILTAQSSPKASSPLSKYLGRKAAPASQHQTLTTTAAPLVPQDLNQMLSDESYSTIALVLLGCKTKAGITKALATYLSDTSTPFARKAFINHSTRALDEKIRLVVDDALQRSVICLRGKAARRDGRLLLERANITLV